MHVDLLLLLLVLCRAAFTPHYRTCVSELEYLPHYQHYRLTSTLIICFGMSCRKLLDSFFYSSWLRTDIRDVGIHAIYTTKGDAYVCLCAKFDQFLPVRSHFDTKHPVNFFHIATFPSPTFGPLFAFHCPLVFLRKTII